MLQKTITKTAEKEVKQDALNRVGFWFDRVIISLNTINVVKGTRLVLNMTERVRLIAIERELQEMRETMELRETR